MITNTSLQNDDKNAQSVLIMGGGHVGLSLALCLAFYGIKSTLIEKNCYPTVSPNDDRRQYLDSRNTALSRRTVQIYGEIGLWDSLKSHACRIDTVEIYEKDTFGHATLKNFEEKVENFGFVMENAHLGFCLLSKAKANPLIDIIDGVQVVDIIENNDNISIRLSDEQVLTAKLLIASDGQHSTARTHFGVGVSEHDYRQTAIVGVVQTDTPHAHTAIECFSPLGPLALLPLADDTDLMSDNPLNNQEKTGSYRSVVWICKTGDEGRYLSDDELFLKELQATFGAKAGRFIKAGKRGAYPLKKVLADKQVIGRCVLLGNSAHTLHPVAGQGFNLCMRDVHTLANMLKIAQETGRDFGDFAMLMEYENRRLTDQKRVILFCDVVIGSFCSTNPILKFGRNVGLLVFQYVPFIKPMVARFAMGLKS